MSLLLRFSVNSFFYLKCESEAVFRTIVTAKEAGAPVYVTKVTSCSAADIISKARKRGEILRLLLFFLVFVLVF